MRIMRKRYKIIEEVGLKQICFNKEGIKKMK